MSFNKQEYLKYIEEYLIWDKFNTDFNENPQEPRLKHEISKKLFNNPSYFNNTPIDVIAMYTGEKEKDSVEELNVQTKINLDYLVKDLVSDINGPQHAAHVITQMHYNPAGKYEGLTELHKSIQDAKKVHENKDLDTASRDLIEKYGVAKAIIYHVGSHPESLFDIYQGIIEARSIELIYGLTNKKSGELKGKEFGDFIKHLTTNPDDKIRTELLKTIGIGFFQKEMTKK